MRECPETGLQSESDGESDSESDQLVVDSHSGSDSTDKGAVSKGKGPGRGKKSAAKMKLDIAHLTTSCQMQKPTKKGSKQGSKWQVLLRGRIG